jgi:hypothetical protein
LQRGLSFDGARAKISTFGLNCTSIEYPKTASVSSL